MNNHRTAVKKGKGFLVYQHFLGNSECNLSHLKIQPIEKILDFPNEKDRKSERLKRESYWIKELRTLTPYGLNSTLDHKNWRFKSRDDIVGNCFNPIPPRAANRRGKRGSGKNRIKHFSIDKVMSDLESFYNDRKNWRFLTNKKIFSLSIKNLRKLSWKLADQSLLRSTKLPGIVFDFVWDIVNFKIYRIKKKKTLSSRKFGFSIPVYYEGKNLESLNLNSLLRSTKKLFPGGVINSPNIIWRRSKPIGKYIFNYRKVVENLSVKNWKSDNLNTCDCSSPLLKDFCDPTHKHIITGRLKIIQNKEIRSLLSKGPKYREPQNILKWGRFFTRLKKTLNECILKWTQQLRIPKTQFLEWKNTFLNAITNRMEKINLKKKKRFYKKMSFSKPDILLELKKLQEKFVFVPTDKAGNNISVICKKFYIEQSLRELDIFEVSPQNKIYNGTYIQIDENIDSIINTHVNFIRKTFSEM